MTRPSDPGALAPLLAGLANAGRQFAIATVIEAEHSTPVKAGARAVVEGDGTIHGSVGGGQVEAGAQQRARGAIRNGRPEIIAFDLGGHDAAGSQPVCGGRMRLLLAPGTVAAPEDYRRAAAARTKGEPGIWVTTMRADDDLAVEARFIRATEVPTYEGLPSADALSQALAAETPTLHRGLAHGSEGTVDVFLEPCVPPPVLLIVGGGHVGQAVAAQASLAGFEIVVIEDRPEFARPNLFPDGTTTRCGPVPEEVGAFPVGGRTFIVIVTRGHQHDASALRACIRRPAAYLGMIGSRRKVPLLRRQFLENGWATAVEFDRVYAPVGLDIGALTVPEIAASIVAQLIAVRRRGSALRIGQREAP